MQVDAPRHGPRELRAAGRPDLHHVDAVGPDHGQEREPAGVGGTKIFTRTAGRNATVDGAGLYPYLDGVGVYAGPCPANDPSAYNANYFVPGAPRGYHRAQPRRQPAHGQRRDADAARERHPPGGGHPDRTVPSWFRTQVRGHVARHRLRQPRLRGPARRPGHRPEPRPSQFDLALPFGKYRICAATRGRTSGTTGTATPAATTIDRRYTTTTTAGTSPTNPADQALTTVPRRPTSRSRSRRRAPPRRRTRRPCATDAPPPASAELRRVGLHAPGAAHRDGDRHGRADGGVHAARPHGLQLGAHRRPPGGRPARPPRDGAR